jgi:hypothetical protein
MTKLVVKHTHHLEWELTYNIVLAYVLALLDLTAIRFKFHDRIKHRSSTFKVWHLGPRKVMSISTHNNIRCGFAQLSVHPQLTLGAYSRTHAWSTNQCVQIVRGSRSMACSILTHALSRTKSKGLPIDIPFYPYTFYTRSTTYKKQAAHDWRPVLFLYFLHAQRRIKQGAPDWCPVLFVYLLYLQFCMFPIDDHYTFHTQ